MMKEEQPVNGWYSGYNLPENLWEDGAIYLYPEGDKAEETDELFDEGFVDEGFVGESCGEPHTILYGDWTEHPDGTYSPDQTGEYAAEYDPNTNELVCVWSAHISYGTQGSLCIPGQVYAQPREDLPVEAGERPFKWMPYYALPTSLFGQDQVHPLAWATLTQEELRAHMDSPRPMISMFTGQPVSHYAQVANDLLYLGNAVSAHTAAIEWIADRYTT